MTGQKYHLLGIGGIGMSGLARALIAQGCAVSGSDLRASGLTEALEREGAHIFIGHRPENLNGPHAVVVSAAIREDNPELAAARRRGLPILSRGELLGRLMESGRGVAVTGTHGKTTTTGMLAVILMQTDADPTVLLGGEMAALGGNARIGQGGVFLTEACEAYETFLSLHPEVAVITNIEPDHLDHYGTFERVIESFGRFVAGIKPGGVLIGCGQDPEVRKLLAQAGCRTISYGLDAAHHLQAEEVRPLGLKTAYTLRLPGGDALPVLLSVPGRHNVLNSLGAIAAAREAGVPAADAVAAVSAFTGVGRRFEVLADRQGVRVVDDYAHHPTEIRATLEAARLHGKPQRLIAVFQPHLYSRTRQFLEQFAGAFDDADDLILTDIYAAREAPESSVSGQLLAERAAAVRGSRLTEYNPSQPAIAGTLAARIRPGDLVVTLGAGDIRWVGEQLAAHVERTWAR